MRAVQVLPFSEYQPSPEPDASIVITGDFNFDGSEEFGIQDRVDGPYGVPTYSIFSERLGRFVRSSQLTDIASRSIVAPRVDASTRALRIASKDGCCYHWLEWYATDEGRAELIRRETMASDNPDEFCTVTTAVWSGAPAPTRAVRPCLPHETD